MSDVPKIPLDSYEAFTRNLEDREYFGQKLGFERIQRLLDRLGNPEKKFQSIHIAGTNGKGSTAAMIASILREAGQQVGLYTSPHLIDFCERIRVGDELITAEEVLHYVRMIRVVEEEPLTFFELATAIAFLHFAEEKVSVAVIETGLGGRLDATNVITPLISVITTIGRDHTAHLGESIEEIAFEKAGIIKPGVPVTVGMILPEAMEVIREAASVKGAPLHPFNRTLVPDDIPLGLVGHHQIANACVAVATTHLLREVGAVREPPLQAIDQETIWKGLETVSWPCRLETVSEAPWVLLDGAHNVPAMQAVGEFLEDRLEGRRLVVLFAAMADKDLKGILSELAPITDEFVFTTPRLKRSAEPGRLVEIASDFGKKCSVVDGVTNALETLLVTLKNEDVLLITGSLFLVGEARKWFQEN